MERNSTTKEKSLRPELNAAPRSGTAAEAKVDAAASEPLDDRIVTALRAAGDKKAIKLVVLDLREVASFTDYFVITSGTNVRQVQAIADEVVERLKKTGTRALRIEGYKTAEWVLVDYGDFIVHVFEDKARQFYDLERLWRESKNVDLAADGIDDPESLLRSEAS